MGSIMADSSFHNVWAFQIWRKLGRSRYVSSYVICYSKNEFAFHEDPFTHILLIHAAHSLPVSPHPPACDVAHLIHCFQVHHPRLSTHIRIYFKLLALQCASCWHHQLHRWDGFSSIYHRKWWKFNGHFGGASIGLKCVKKMCIPTSNVVKHHLTKNSQ